MFEELLLIFFVVLIVFGPKKMHALYYKVGRIYGSLRHYQTKVQNLLIESEKYWQLEQNIQRAKKAEEKIIPSEVNINE